MSRYIILEETLDVLRRIEFSLALKFDQSRFWRYEWALSTALRTPEGVRSRLRALNKHLEGFDLQAAEFSGDRDRPLDWLYFEHELEVVPLYDEALAIVERERILPASEIPLVLAFMGIPKTNEGLDVENHGTGYHFHYGRVKNNALKRYDVLLTFNKSDQVVESLSTGLQPLYVEQHASGKCKHVDPSTIGHNKRLPIYLVCEQAMRSRKLENFMLPSADAWRFYPAP